MLSEMICVSIILSIILLTVFITGLIIKNDNKKFEIDLEEKINTKYLDDDSLFFFCKHDLSINKSDYTEAELAAIKTKALKEKEEYRNKNSENLYNIINN